MSNEIDEPEELDERLSAWILAYEHRHHSGVNPKAASECQLPPEVRPRASEVKSCLDLLAEFRESLALPELPPVAFEHSREVDGVQRIAQFEIVETLGIGGFGIVYRAWEPLTHRQVALKVPRPETLVSREMQRRFEQEARAAAKLDHPNIVPVLEAGTDGQVPYIASVYYPCVTLAAWLSAQKRPVAPRLAAELVVQLADALNHAHLRGVLHRDIKPSNVLLVPFARSVDSTTFVQLPLSDFEPKVADFGLAKLTETENEHTRTGMMLGTLLYMAPEQAEGRVRDIAEQTDIYALGAVLYELLTGRAPLSDVTGQSMLHNILLREPGAPHRLVAGIPRDLSAICLKCLEKAPSLRYASAAALADDLNRYLGGQPTMVRPLGPLRRLAKWAGRRPAIATLAALLCLSILTMLVGSISYSARLQRSLAEVQHQRTVAEQAVQDTKLTLYASDMQRAQQAWRHNNLAQVAQVLASHEPQPGESDRREFAWHYLRNLGNREIATLTGHEGDVFSVACSPDGALWASGGKDATVRLWNAATHQPQAVFRGHTDEVTEVVFSPNGQFVASGGEDGTVRVWAVATGEARTIEAHTDHVLCLAYSADGTRLASGGRDKTIRIWDTGSLKLIAERVLVHDAIATLAFMGNGTGLLASDLGGKVYKLDSVDGRVLDETGIPHEQFFSLAFTPANPLLAYAGRQGVIRLVGSPDARLAESSQLRGGHAEWIQALAFSPVARVLASADKAGVIQLWDLESQERRSILGHPDQVWSLAWSPDGKVLASAGGNGAIRLWNAAERADGSTIYPTLPRQIESLSYSLDGKTLVAAMHEMLAQFDVAQQTLLDKSSRDLDLVYDDPSSLTQSRHGSFISTAACDSTWVGVGGLKGPAIAVINKPDGYHVWESEQAISSDGRRIAWEKNPARVVIGDLTSGAQVTIDCEDNVYHLAFAPDNIHLAVCAQSGLYIWNCATKKLERTLPVAEYAVYSRDGTLLIAARVTALCIYESSSGQLRQTFVNRPSRIRAMDLSPDNRTLAVGTRLLNRVELLDVRSGQDLLTLNVESHDISSIAFSPQGHRLAVAGSDEEGASHIWEWTSLPDGVVLPSKALQSASATD